MRNVKKAVFESQAIAVPTNSVAIDIGLCEGYCLQASWVDITQSAKPFAAAAVDIATENITVTAHNLVVGVLGRLTTTVSLPAGLALATDYFVIVVDANTIRLASSLANALAGTPIDITSQGTGTHTFTPTALAGTIKLQGSVDGVSYSDVTGSSTVLSTLSVLLNVPDAFYPWVRMVVGPTAGEIRISAILFAKGGA